MAIDSKESALNYFKRSIRKLPYSDLEELLPKHLRETLSSIESDLRKRRYLLNSKNLAEALCDACKEKNWEIRQILQKAVFLELEYIARHSKSYRWQAHRLIHESLNETSETFGKTLRRTIQANQENAVICKVKYEDLLWYAVIYKRPEICGLFETPNFFAISTDLVYIFTKKSLPTSLIQAIFDALRCKKMDALKLDGRNVSSLLRLLRGSENRNQSSRSQFRLPTPVITDSPDCNEEAAREAFIKKHLDNDVNIPTYTVQSETSRWAGDDSPELKLMEVRTELKFIGDVEAILRNVVRRGICGLSPCPNYIRQFKVLGKNWIQISNPNSTIRN